MTMSDIVTTTSMDEIISLTSASVESSATARVYRQTYSKWGVWCAQREIPTLALTPTNVLRFLAEQDVTKATRQRQLSALRTLVKIAYVLNPTDDMKRNLEGLALIKVPSDPSKVAGNGKERPRRALAPNQADKVLRVWMEENNAHLRNKALIALLMLSGVRRSEAAALKWDEVDFENGVVTVRHGKGDKQREVPLAGEYALDALKRWKTVSEGRKYVFCAVNKGDNLGADVPITGTDIYRIVKATEQRSGIEFKPHDLRRTLITEALATGTPLATVQAIAGHARGETTLSYAQAVDARQARKALKLRYG